MIEQKGKDAITVDNHKNLIIASNNEWVIPADMDSRRFLVLEMSDKYQQDKDYFSKINEEMENGGVEAMMYDLMNLDISGVDLMSVPRTNALFDQIQKSMSPEQSYWYERLNEGNIPKITKDELDMTLRKFEDWVDEIEIPKDELHADYLKFCDNLHVRYRKSKDLFCKEIKQMCPEVVSSKKRSRGIRKQYFELPPLKVAREQFESLVKMNLGWDMPDYWDQSEENITDPNECFDYC